MTDIDREALFDNEALLIGMLQAVSGGAIVAGLAQLDVLNRLAGQFSTLIYFTAAALALLFAVLAAYWKHQYKKWDLKAAASRSRAEANEATARGRKSAFYLACMRFAMGLSVLFFVLGVAFLIGAFWYQYATLQRVV
ncbi:MAG: hypothetical protein DME95_02505 [Verrucomicrobia bacterium]|nr:MAG: hypothetical protein DME95_02505 [Verrucomicrobiota bacterium]